MNNEDLKMKYEELKEKFEELKGKIFEELKKGQFGRGMENKELSCVHTAMLL